jgi:hypothetical protein
VCDLSNGLVNAFTSEGKVAEAKEVSEFISMLVEGERQLQESEAAQ